MPSPLAALPLCAVLLGQAGAPPAPAPTPAADAEIVDEEVRVLLTRDGRAFESGRRSVLVRTEAGADEAALVLPVLPFTEITHVAGTLVLPDGRKVPLEPRDVIQRPYFEGAAVASNVKLLVATFPRLVPGSTCHLSWERKVSSLIYLSDWKFRGRLPIRRSQYRITESPGTEVRYTAWNGTIEPVITTSPEGRVLTFEVKDSKALPDEPYSPSLSEREGVVQFTAPRYSYGPVTVDSTHWGGIASFYGRLAADHYALDPAVTSEIRALARRLRKPRAILEALHERLKRFRYVQVYLGMDGYQPHAALWTWKRGYGDCKDLATVFISMARAAGIEAHPMLVQVGDRRTFLPSFPSPRQFDHCVAYVPLPEGPVIVDATAPVYPLGELPGPLAGAPALVVDGRGDPLPITLPSLDPSASSSDNEISISPGAAGPITGTLHGQLTGDFRASASWLVKNGRDTIDGEDVDRAVPGAAPGLRLSAVRWTDEAGRLEIRAALQATRETPRTGNRSLVAVALFLDEPRAAAFSSATRETPVDLGLVASSRLRVRVQGATFTACPPPVDVTGPFGSYRLDCSADGNDVVLDRRLVVAQTWIEPADYPGARSFWSAVVDGDRRAVVAEAMIATSAGGSDAVR